MINLGKLIRGQMTQIKSENVIYSWTKVLMWAFLFYLVWNWKGIVLVYSEGLLPGPDDFLRLSQSRNWLMGQAWYDVRAYGIYPPFGADIHWTRFVDVPIGLLISFFNIFTDITTAERLTGIVWPLGLFLVTLSAMVSLCDRLCGKQHRLLVLFFFVMSLSTLAEFKPGRFDHHNIQILLLVLIMLGIVHGLGKYSSYFIGVLATLSIVVGLDSLLLIVSLLGYLAVEWSFNRKGSAKRLLETGIAILLSSIVLYMASFPPERWFSNNACDAFSSLYLLALIALSVTFIVLSHLSEMKFFSGNNALLNRTGVGGVFALIIVAGIFLLFPHCLDGPYSNVYPELQTQWLDKIVEAKGLVESFSIKPSNWISQGAYLAIMVSVISFVLLKKGKTNPELLIMGFVVAVCILGAFHQNRVLRTGLYAVIPFCVIFIALINELLSKKYEEKSAVLLTIKAFTCLALTSTFWFTVAILSEPSKVSASNTTANLNTGDEIPPLECTSEASMIELRLAKTGHVMSDLNTATSLLVHTNHTVEAGSYHRNGESILNVLHFFEKNADAAMKIAAKRNVDYVVLCRDNIPSKNSNSVTSLAAKIGLNEIPEWLEWMSKPDAQLAVLKVRH